MMLHIHKFKVAGILMIEFHWQDLQLFLRVGRIKMPGGHDAFVKMLSFQILLDQKPPSLLPSTTDYNLQGILFMGANPLKNKFLQDSVEFY